MEAYSKIAVFMYHVDKHLIIRGEVDKLFSFKLYKETLKIVLALLCY